MKMRRALERFAFLVEVPRNPDELTTPTIGDNLIGLSG